MPITKIYRTGKRLATCRARRPASAKSYGIPRIKRASRTILSHPTPSSCATLVCSKFRLQLPCASCAESSGGAARKVRKGYLRAEAIGQGRVPRGSHAGASAEGARKPQTPKRRRRPESDVARASKLQGKCSAGRFSGAACGRMNPWALRI